MIDWQLIQVDRGLATLIAAIIAAVAAILGLKAQRTSEFRAAHRNILNPYIHELGKSIHEAVAASKILLNAKSSESLANWRERAGIARDSLKELRPKLRYPLWGLDKALRDLSRLPDWIEHARDFDKHSKKLLKRGESLANTVDRCVRRAYAYGRPPRMYERILLKIRRISYRRYYSRFMKKKKEQRR